MLIRYVDVKWISLKFWSENMKDMEKVGIRLIHFIIKMNLGWKNVVQWFVQYSMLSVRNCLTSSAFDDVQQSLFSNFFKEDGDSIT